MSWNYRLCKHLNGSIEIREVHYDENGKPLYHGKPMLCSDDEHAVADLRGTLDLMLLAFDKPILELNTIFGRN